VDRQLIAVNDRGVADLKRYHERFIEATQKKDSLATPVNVLSWTVNEVQNIQRNLRLDAEASLAELVDQRGQVNPAFQL